MITPFLKYKFSVSSYALKQGWVRVMFKWQTQTWPITRLPRVLTTCLSVFQSSVCYVKAALPRVLDLLSVHFRYSRGSESALSVRSLQNLIHNIYSQRCVPPLNEQLEVCACVSEGVYVFLIVYMQMSANVCVPLRQNVDLTYVASLTLVTKNCLTHKIFQQFPQLNIDN